MHIEHSVTYMGFIKNAIHSFTILLEKDISNT